jgi:putative aldouronate transport system permease protein
LSNSKINNKIPESKAYRAFQIFNYIFMGLVAIVCILPMINVFAISLSSPLAGLAGEVKLIPVDFTTQAYRFVMNNKEFWNAMLVSLRRILLGGSIGITLTVLTAYPLSRSPEAFKARNYYVWFIFFTMLFGGGLIPSYFFITWTKLYGTIWALVIPGAVSAWNCILMLNFFRNLPRELEEAAFIDGAGHWTILWKIIVPVSKPVIATVLLFIMVGHWNSWFDGYIYMNSPRQYPLQTYLYSMASFDPSKAIEQGVDAEYLKKLSEVSSQNLSAAQIFIGAIPILVVYPLLQKHFTKGIVLGSVKG